MNQESLRFYLGEVSTFPSGWLQVDSQAMMQQPTKPEADDDIYPEGVQLRDFNDFDSIRSTVFDAAKDQIIKAFPQKHGNLRIDLADVDYVDPERFSLKDQKKALLENKFLSRRLRGTVRLVDETDNKVLDERPLTLMRVPYVTQRGSIIMSGNEYASVVQMRLLPGAYTRRQANGEIETQINARPRTGVPFRIGFEPASAQYRFRVQSANLHLYSLLKDIGVDDKVLEKSWGPDVLDMNRKKYDSRVFDKAYTRLVSKFDLNPEATREEKAAAIKAALDKTMVHEDVMRRNLPNMFDMEKAAEWRARIAGQELMEKVAGKTPPHMEKRIPMTATMVPDAVYDEEAAGDPVMDALLEQAISGADVLPEADEIQNYADVADLDPDEILPPEPGMEDIIDDEPLVLKQADEAGFKPDLSAEDMQDAYNAIYGKMGPQLASLEKWPQKWFPPGADQQGWISWYQKYANGERSEDDARQIARWKAFKARHGAAFKANPTPRRAFALRNWAVDPIKLIDDADTRTAVTGEMEEYRKNMEAMWLKEHMDKEASTLPSLLKAKKESDRGHYIEKHQILARLMRQRPEDWVVDDATGKYYGVTHVPTGFKLHAPREIVPMSLQQKQKPEPEVGDE